MVRVVLADVVALGAFPEVAGVDDLRKEGFAVLGAVVVDEGGEGVAVG